ncbi:hypothetical protein [Pseudomonas sp. OV546]|uniref:hypothetical protein n=1 Tax=Pseudomonas sp. OV546 TaxID=1881063 RepID=UPI0008E90220|nr:hypothetical protein [Pseudomonas sp. OV546]SFU95399.1 hypothetical protein SAMN05428951_10764 [Pseudomonas sp. OV546]
MKVHAMCHECQLFGGNPLRSLMEVEYYESEVTYTTCKAGHKSVVLFNSQKFEILLESSANAILAGFTLEAASSISAAYERFFEFAILVLCKSHGITRKQTDEAFKQVSKQSERQVGAFLFLYLIVFKKTYKLNQDISTTRNKIIHQGHIPTPEEVLSFGDMVYREVLGVVEVFIKEYIEEVRFVVNDDLQSKKSKLPEGTLLSTTGGTKFFSIYTDNQPSYREALELYKMTSDVFAIGCRDDM